MILNRLINSSVVENEKYADYLVDSISQAQSKEILSSFIDGVFGVELSRIFNDQSFTFFSQPNYKCKLHAITNNSAQYLNSNKDNTTFANMYTSKASVFPIDMKSNESFWNILCTLIPSHINIKYQLLLVYRQDNWKDRIIEQYHDYLNGVQSPSNSGLFRKLQRGITEKVDSILKWEQRHSEINEIKQKIKENGFRFNIKFALIGGSKLEREYSITKVRDKVNEFSYTNEWIIDYKIDFKYGSESINQRRLDYQSKNYTLCESELLPFITIEQNNQLESISVSTKDVEVIQCSNNTIFDLLPKGDDLDQFDGTELANKFINAVKELKPFKGTMELLKYQSGSTTMKITFRIPKQLKLSEISKINVVNDIQMRMGIKQLQIKQGEDVGELDVILPLESRQKVFLANYINDSKFREFANNNPLPFLVGVDEIGNPIYGCMNKIKHLLVAGSTGSGKSIWLNQLILTLLMLKNSTQLQMFMIDIKQVELVQFSAFRQVQKVVTDADEAVQLLNQLIKEMDKRYELFKNANVKNIALYNKKTKNKLPYIVVVIDEYAELKNRNSDIDNYVQSLTQLSRACGIHLIIATQRPSVDIISGVIKSNLPSKIGFRCANKRSYLTFLNTSPKFELLGNGDGVMSFEGQMEDHIRFQGCLIVDDPFDEGIESELIKRIADTIGTGESKFELPVVKVVNEDSDLDKLKRVIANHNTTKIAELREIMKININKLNDMMKELVNENWLEKPETKQSGYKLIIGEDELCKWRK